MASVISSLDPPPLRYMCRMDAVEQRTAILTFTAMT
jgi:hypothetical protein